MKAHTTSLGIETKEILRQLLDTTDRLTPDEYTERIPLLSNATIGEHTRHIIELFQQLFSGYDEGRIHYDDRKRDFRLQEQPDFASKTIGAIITSIEKPNKKLHIVTSYHEQETSIDSNYERELLYNLEHCIHHQAIIKIGLLYLNKMNVDADFGVAKSTLEYRKKCVQ